MIIVQLQGGIGNQMFQYAFGRALAEKHRQVYKLDLSFLENKTGDHTDRDFELNVFNIKTGIAGKNELHKFFLIHNNKILRRIHHKIHFSPYFKVSEHRFTYIPDISQYIKKNTLLTGFWQSQKYFMEYEEIIREEFSFIPVFSLQNYGYAQKITNSNSVSIHVRRGDYVTNDITNSYHGLCDLDYYRKAFEYISSETCNITLFVFSDDVEWAKKNIVFNVETFFVEHNTGKESYNDMRLMSLCKHNIIANSSFSWWAAWLNTNKSKIIVAPVKWFNNKDTDTSDLIPETWVRM